jgi:hypothetical protein
MSQSVSLPYGAFELKRCYQRNMMAGIFTVVAASAAAIFTLAPVRGPVLRKRLRRPRTSPSTGRPSRTVIRSAYGLGISFGSR